MVTWVAEGVVLTGLTLAALAGVATARGRRVDAPQLIAAAVCEVASLLQVVVGVVQLVRLDGGGGAGSVGSGAAAHVSPVVFGGYLLCLLVVPPLGAFWAVGERSRWGTGVLAIAGLVNAVLIARLEQVWRHGG